MNITVDKRQLAALQTALEGTKKKLPRELANAINKTASKTKTTVSKEIRKELAVSAKDVNRFLKIKGRAVPNKLSSAVNLDHTKRPGIGGPTDRFKPKQTRRGTSFKISKKQGRKMIPEAFMGPRPGKKAPKLHGGVFKRRGRRRNPIQKMHGASPWAAYLKNNMDPVIKNITGIELHKQVDSRIRTILKQKGLT